MPKRKKTTVKTPTFSVVPFHCEDKDYDNAPVEEHPLSMPANARIVCCAMPGRGKSSLAKNVLCRGGYERVFVAHGGGDTSHEYSLVDHEPINFMDNTPDWFMEQSRECNGGRMILICDDINMQDLSREEKGNLYRVCQYVCTHAPMTLLVTGHTWVQIIPRVRRLCDVVCIWPPDGGADQISYIARSLGVNRGTLGRAFSKCKTKFDFVMRDLNGPEYGRAMWRINGCEDFDAGA